MSRTVKHSRTEAAESLQAERSGTLWAGPDGAAAAGGPTPGRAQGGACSLSHKCTEGAKPHPLDEKLSPGQVEAVLEWSNGLIRVRAKMGQPAGAVPEHRPKRGIIGAWSPASRLRAYRGVSALPWPVALGANEDVLFVTLTYPDEWSKDGRKWQRHLRRVRRWLRNWGFWGGVWKREHQARGAPHFHLWCVTPLSSDDRPEGWLRCLREELSKAWYEIVGSGDLKHLAAGTQVKVLPPGQSAVGYFKAYMQKLDEGKEYQHKLPPDVHHPGRWWGSWGKPHFAPEWRVRRIAFDEFHKARRLMRRYSSARRRRAVHALRLAAVAAGVPFRRRRVGVKLPRLWTTGMLAGVSVVANLQGYGLYWWIQRALGIT